MASLWRPPKQPGDFDLDVDRRDRDTTYGPGARRMNRYT